MAARPAARAGIPLAALAALALLGGCSTPEEAMSPSEWIDANATVFSGLKSYEARERRQAISRLKSLGEEQGRGIVFWVLSDPKLEDYRLEVMLARLLADWKDRRAIPFLLESLRVPDDGVVRIAEEGILVFGDDPHTLERLGDMLVGDSVRERGTAAGLLARLGSQQAAGVLGGRIKLELDPEVRAQLVIGVMHSRHPRRLEFLVDALTDPDPAIRELAWGAVSREPGLPDVGYSPSGTDVERARSVGALRVWLSREGGRGRPGAR